MDASFIAFISARKNFQVGIVEFLRRPGVAGGGGAEQLFGIQHGVDSPVVQLHLMEGRNHEGAVERAPAGQKPRGAVGWRHGDRQRVQPLIGGVASFAVGRHLPHDH